MKTNKDNIKGNRTHKSALVIDYSKARLSLNEKFSTLLKLGVLLVIGTFLVSCATYRNTNNNSNEIVITKITTYQTSLSKSDVSNYFCNNLTEYFNTYKFYKISSEIYSEKEKQKSISTTKITKQGVIYNVEYIGSAGKYLVSFSYKNFPEAEEIFTFGRRTVLGNAIRDKIYDTFTAWLERQKIALKANNNSYLYSGELDAGIEVEKWYNSLSTNE